jgi:hypothetical protein
VEVCVQGLRTIGVSLLALSLMAAACGGGDDGEETPEATPTPERPAALDRIGEWVAENRNVDFVGACEDAREGVDVGRLCATQVGSRGTLVAYHIGPTFSEYTAVAILDETEGGWEIVEVSNRNPNEEGVPGINWPLQVGDRVVVVGLGEDDCLNVREQPSTDAAQLICVGDGTEAIVQEGPVDGASFTWWRIAGEGFDGWSAGTWLRLPEAIEALFATPTPEGEGE